MHPICRDIVSKYTNKTLKKIVNVFQVQFKDFKAPGFGDYIRGCFCMMQLIHTVNKYCGTHLIFEMDLRNHLMSKWIEVDSYDSSIEYKSIGNFHIDVLKVPQDESTVLFQHILRQSTEYFNKIQTEIFYCFCCKYEVYDEIRNSDKEYIRSFLKPNAEMQSLIHTTLNSFGLKAKEYSVLHIRRKDEESFPPTKLSTEDLDRSYEFVKKYYDFDKDTLLITNHNDIKRFYTTKSHPKLHIQIGEICHVGQDQNQSENQVRDTLLDFFLLANAKEIIAFSAYGHGTGFSQECAKLYNVPHTLIKLT